MPPRYRDVMELTLQNTREIALMQAAIYRTFLVPYTEGNPHPYAQKAEEIGYEYNEMTQAHAKEQLTKAGKDRVEHGLGSPHLHVWLAWMRVLGEERDLLTAPEKAKVQKHLDEVKGNQQALAHLITVARSNKVRDVGTRRLQYEYTHKQEELGQILAKAIVHYGGVEKLGAAPRGPRERRVRQWLTGQPEEDWD